MWKKRLIATVTFLAGLYFFLEFIIPATSPFGSIEGVALNKVSGNRITVGQVKRTSSTSIKESTPIRRKGETETVAPQALTPGDVIEIESEGKTVSGILMPSSSPTRLDLGKITGHESTEIKPGGKTLIFRKTATGAPSKIDPKDIEKNYWIVAGPNTYLTGWITNVNDFLLVLFAMAWGMGLLSLWLVHSANIRKRRREWYLSVIFFVSLLGGIIAAIGAPTSGGSISERWAWAVPVNNVVFNDLLVPMGSTVFSLLTFYMASAAYRSFKAKSGEAILMMISATIIMLGQVSLYAPLTAASSWIQYIANTAAVRGMWFGMMLGGIAVGLRFWLSLERGAFFDGEL